VNIGGISRKTVAIYGTINFGAINLLLQKMEQFYGAIIWYHLMAPFYGMCVPSFTLHSRYAEEQRTALSHTGKPQTPELKQKAHQPVDLKALQEKCYHTSSQHILL